MLLETQRKKEKQNSSFSLHRRSGGRRIRHTFRCKNILFEKKASQPSARFVTLQPPTFSAREQQAVSNILLLRLCALYALLHVQVISHIGRGEATYADGIHVRRRHHHLHHVPTLSWLEHAQHTAFLLRQRAQYRGRRQRRGAGEVDVGRTRDFEAKKTVQNDDVTRVHESSSRAPRTIKVDTYSVAAGTAAVGGRGGDAPDSREDLFVTEFARAEWHSGKHDAA